MDSHPNPRFPNLFQPLQVGPITLRNRVTIPAHQPRLAKDSLPSDAYIERVVMFVSCSPDRTCGDPPFVFVRRGDSSAWVEEKTGRITESYIALGDEHAFDFLRDALR